MRYSRRRETGDHPAGRAIPTAGAPHPDETRHSAADLLPLVRWSTEFLEAGKKRLAGDTARAATSDEVKELRQEASALKEVVAELMLENRLLKKSTIGAGEDAA